MQRREKAARGRLCVMCRAQMIQTLSNLKVDFKKKKLKKQETDKLRITK